MGRKNGKVRRQNEKGRLQRGARGISPSLNAFPDQPRVPVEEIVMPDGRCFVNGRNKTRFATEEKAARALAQAQQQRRRTGSTHVEKRYYPCPDGCGGFHLSSREGWDEEVVKVRREVAAQRAADLAANLALRPKPGPR